MCICLSICVLSPLASSVALFSSRTVEVLRGLQFVYGTVLVNVPIPAITLEAMHYKSAQNGYMPKLLVKILQTHQHDIFRVVHM